MPSVAKTEPTAPNASPISVGASRSHNQNRSRPSGRNPVCMAECLGKIGNQRVVHNLNAMVRRARGKRNVATSAAGVLVIRRQQVTMRLDQVVHKRPDLVQAQFGGGVRVEHGGMVDVLALARKRCLHGQLLHVDVGAHHGR